MKSSLALDSRELFRALICPKNISMETARIRLYIYLLYRLVPTLVNIQSHGRELVYTPLFARRLPLVRYTMAFCTISIGGHEYTLAQVYLCKTPRVSILSWNWCPWWIASGPAEQLFLTADQLQIVVMRAARLNCWAENLSESDERCADYSSLSIAHGVVFDIYHPLTHSPPTRFVHIHTSTPMHPRIPIAR